MLLLDEATAALDPATEAVVLAASDLVPPAAPRSWSPTAWPPRPAPTASSSSTAAGSSSRARHAELLAAGGHYAGLWAAGELEPAA